MRTLVILNSFWDPMRSQNKFWMTRKRILITSQEIIQQLKSMKNAQNVEGMKRFGINGGEMLGIPAPDRRSVSKQFLRLHKKELEYRHKIAQELWDSGVHEAMMMASDIDMPTLVTEAQMEAWANDFNSWDIVDQTCGTLFDKTLFAFGKASQWAQREEEFVRRAGFALMAWLAIHDKQASDEKLARFFPLIELYSTDERNFVKKAVNWALRQIGKRNANLKKEALKISEKLKNSPDKTAHWIGSDAYRELINR